MNISFRMAILITAVGVPALVIGLGWIEKMMGYALSNAHMVSDGDFWMLVGVIVYLAELFVGMLWYAYEREQGNY